VDLQSVQNINSITVWGRTDCCWEMAQNFYVFVSDNPFTSTDLNTTLNQPGVTNYYYGPYANPGVIAVNRTGRYVRVQLAGTQYLVMGEVQVWGGSTGQVNWIVPDHLGTPRMIADQTGSLANVKRHDYLPFGEEIGLIGGRTGAKGFMNDGMRQKFTGYERDWETGLDYAKARYDASAQGRFLSVDPLLASADVASPQSLNRYSYVENNPLNLTDPTGMMPYDASHSFADVSDHFWGGGMDFSRPHPSRGQYIIAAAQYVHDGSIAANIAEQREAEMRQRYYRRLTGFRIGNLPNPFTNSAELTGMTLSSQSAGATEQPLTTEQGNQVWNALELGRKAMEARPLCSKYVGAGAYQAMRALWDSGRFTYFHGIQGGTSPGQGPAWAETGLGPGLFDRYRTVLFFGFFNDAMINSPHSNGAHFLGISRIEFQATILMHEVRHYLCPRCKYAEPHDANTWNKDIVKYCFK
jgi:RHS repeat-associated protein